MPDVCPRRSLRTGFRGRRYCGAAQRSLRQQSRRGAQSLLRVPQAVLAWRWQQPHPSAGVTALLSATSFGPAGLRPGLAFLASVLAGVGISLNSSCCFPRISLISFRLGSSSSVRNWRQQFPNTTANGGQGCKHCPPRDPGRREGSSALQPRSWSSSTRPAGSRNRRLTELTP